MSRLRAIPLVYLGQGKARDKVRPWLHFRVDGVMVSAYEFMISRIKRERAKSKGLTEVLEFNGPIMLDSGGYQHLKGKDISYSPEDLVKFAHECGADFLFALDYPPRITDNDFQLISKKNFKNYLRMASTMDVIPVIHAPPSLARKEIEFLKPLRPPYVGVGGLVPSLRGWVKMNLETIDLVNAELPESRVHLMGFGAPKIGSRYVREAHSLDYGGWRTAAATSYLLTPNGYRKIGTRNKNGHAARPSRTEHSQIRSVCEKLGLNRRALTKDFGSRAIFNAYVATRIMKDRSL